MNENRIDPRAALHLAASRFRHGPTSLRFAGGWKHGLPRVSRFERRVTSVYPDTYVLDSAELYAVALPTFAVYRARAASDRFLAASTNNLFPKRSSR